MKIIIVGAGLAGATAAFKMKSLGHDVKVFEKRNHIGGNCFDSKIGNIMVHNYGPHIFHTNNHEVWNFVNNFSKFKKYFHSVIARTSIGDYTIPFNKNFLEKNKNISKKEITNILFKDYSEKQWGIPFNKLPKEIINRIPKIRDDYKITFFSDIWQGIPEDGYNNMISKMLSGIDVYLSSDNEWRNEKRDFLFYSGKIDEYYNFVLGQLEYRSLLFLFKEEKKRSIVALNECNKEVSHTRSCDHSYWNGITNKNNMSIISYEYSKKHVHGENIPFYPFPDKKNKKLYNEYKKLNFLKENVIFIGRLGKYKYMNMDETIFDTLNTIKSTKKFL